MPLKITLTLSDSDLRFFRNEIKKAKHDAKEIGEEKILTAARSLVASMEKSTQPVFVQERVEKLLLLIEMVTDESWDLPQRVRTPILNALAYFVHPEDLIADEVPALGFLDDAIMIELIVRELKHDIEAYRDFLDFGGRDKEQSTRGTAEKVDSQAFKVRREKLRRRAWRRNRSDRGRRRGIL